MIGCLLILYCEPSHEINSVVYSFNLGQRSTTETSAGRSIAFRLWRSTALLAYLKIIEVTRRDVGVFMY